MTYKINKQSEIDTLAKIIWDYHHVNHKIKPADIILCFTSLDLSVPEYVAKLYKQNYAPTVLFAGNSPVNPELKKNILTTNWGMSEAEKFKQVTMKNRIPEDAILIEANSTNSQQNVEMSYKLLKKINRLPKSIILVQKPTMERRAYATFMNFWPYKNVDLMVTSPQIAYEDYVGKVVDRDTIINIMVGDLQRIKLYPAKGFQIPQEIPADVWEAYERLVELGFDKHLIAE